MRHHHAGEGRLIHFKEQLEDLFTRKGVQIAGGLVREDDLGAADEGARERDALVLAAGELGGQVVQAVGEADLFQQLAGARAHRSPSADAREARHRRQHHVLDDVQLGHEVEALEDEADARGAQARATARGSEAAEE